MSSTGPVAFWDQHGPTLSIARCGGHRVGYGGLEVGVLGAPWES